MHALFVSIFFELIHCFCFDVSILKRNFVCPVGMKAIEKKTDLESLPLKISLQKRWGYNSVVEDLPCMSKTLGSIPSSKNYIGARCHERCL